MNTDFKSAFTNQTLDLYPTRENPCYEIRETKFRVPEKRLPKQMLQNGAFTATSLDLLQKSWIVSFRPKRS